jgi:hypothetical protein
VLLVLCLTDSSDLDASNLAAALTLLVLSGFLLVPQLSNFNFTFSRQYKDVIKISLAKNSTASGLVVYAPEAGDQCWDSLLPCTPYFNPMLRLRTSKIMKSGFTVGQKNK